MDPARALWLSVVVGAVLRAVFAFGLGADPVSDFDWYHGRAVGLAAGEGYQWRGQPTAYWPVGWPAVLAGAYRAFGPSVEVGRALSVVLSTALIPLTAALARSQTSERDAVLAAWVVALYPTHWLYAGTLASEMLLTGLVLSVLVLGLRREAWSWGLAGLLLGGAMLTKPQYLLVAAPLVLTTGLLRGRGAAARQAAAVALGTALVVTPWTLRNARVLGEPVLVSTNGGLNLLIGNHEHATGGYVFSEPVRTLRESSRPEVDVDAEARELALEWMVTHPARVATLAPVKVLRTWATDLDGWRSVRSGLPADATGRQAVAMALGALGHLVYYPILLGFAVGAWRRRHHPVTVVSTGSVLLVGALYLVFFGGARFHFPLVPLMIPLAVATWRGNDA